MLRREPSHFGYACSRWKLAQLLETCSWLQLESLPGLWQLLRRLGISYQRGRDYVHSPDREYDAKVAWIQTCREQAQKEPERYPFCYLDELSFYRQPSLAQAYEERGRQQPLAQRSYRSNTYARVLAAMNGLTGQVSFVQRSRTDRTCLANFWYQLHQDYPQAETLYVVVDNWPMHFHPDVLAPLRPQNFPFPILVPDNWPQTPSARAKHDQLPIQLLCLPTYASWLNPIEKLWRWLKQEVLHLHRQSDDWEALKEQVQTFLATFAHGSEALLRYTGLSPI